MHKLEINISQELSDTLSLALHITGDNKDELFSKLINQYVDEVLRQRQLAAQRADPEERQPILPMAQQVFHSKAYTRFKGWAKKRWQTNHQIIKAFFACEINGTANRSDMCSVFMQNNPGRAPHYFENNLNSMATDAGNSHGKCFDIIGSTVKFTDEIAPLAEEYKSFFMEVGI